MKKGVKPVPHPFILTILKSNVSEAPSARKTVPTGASVRSSAYSFSLRQAMPGSTLPSRNSREAPPPVEMCVILSA